ncbi:MAG: nicotinate (nicotinamide) nucleotide adenylyltransferase, partial [Parachlamydiaceae bacterium]|nr:nicotinate (nicotinamide) nucleotide adenylyltransferase [Parachlamydiaceae bacterium]
MKQCSKEIKAKNIGIYGGSFDPVHLGHVSLAYEIMEARHLDEVWFCPAFINPFKHNKEPSASPEDRLKMLQIAIAGESRFHLNDIELQRSASSYTVDTLQALVGSQKGKKNPDQFSLIMGEDTAKDFYRWREPEKILELATILIGKRSSMIDAENWKGTAPIQKALQQGLT